MILICFYYYYYFANNVSFVGDLFMFSPPVLSHDSLVVWGCMKKVLFPAIELSLTLYCQ